MGVGVQSQTVLLQGLDVSLDLFCITVPDAPYDTIVYVVNTGMFETLLGLLLQGLEFCHRSGLHVLFAFSYIWCFFLALRFRFPVINGWFHPA